MTRTEKPRNDRNKKPAWNNDFNEPEEEEEPFN